MKLVAIILGTIIALAIFANVAAVVDAPNTCWKQKNTVGELIYCSRDSKEIAVWDRNPNWERFEW